MKLLSIIGARPQFIKASALSKEIKFFNSQKDIKIKDIIIHTGQHFDNKMSKDVFKQLQIPKPTYNLGIQSLSHGAMTGKMIEEIENKVLKIKPDHIITYGDTNSTLAAAIAASKLNAPLSHIESGLRSFNREMPEEINRIITDHVSDFLFCPSERSIKNLKNEGITKNVFLTGDIMYDVFLNNLKKAKKINLPKKINLSNTDFIFVTIHRPVNTDNLMNLRSILRSLDILSKSYQIVFSIHPRTLKQITKHGFTNLIENLICMKPLTYLETMSLLLECRLVITDSGGLQKEAYYAKRNCLTIRDETEWPETNVENRNILSKPFKEEILSNAQKSLSNKRKSFPRIYGNGNCSSKVLKILIKNKSIN